MAYQQLSLDQVTTAATGFKGPEGVSVDRDGNVYGGGTDGGIRKLAPDGTVTEFANTGEFANVVICPAQMLAIMRLGVTMLPSLSL